jgi:hypothetical protein
LAQGLEAEHVAVVALQEHDRAQRPFGSDRGRAEQRRHGERFEVVRGAKPSQQAVQQAGARQKPERHTHEGGVAVQDAQYAPHSRRGVPGSRRHRREGIGKSLPMVVLEDEVAGNRQRAFGVGQRHDVVSEQATVSGAHQLGDQGRLADAPGAREQDHGTAKSPEPPWRKSV